MEEKENLNKEKDKDINMKEQTESKNNNKDEELKKKEKDEEEKNQEEDKIKEKINSVLTMMRCFYVKIIAKTLLKYYAVMKSFAKRI